MNISSVTGMYAQQAYKGQVNATRPVKGGVIDSNTQKSKIPQPRDTVELSGLSSEKIDSIKQKISSGFYNSNEVSEDISDKLTKFFDEATE